MTTWGARGRLPAPQDVFRGSPRRERRGRLVKRGGPGVRTRRGRGSGRREKRTSPSRQCSLDSQPVSRGVGSCVGPRDDSQRNLFEVAELSGAGDHEAPIRYKAILKSALTGHGDIRSTQPPAISASAFGRAPAPWRNIAGLASVLNAARPGLSGTRHLPTRASRGLLHSAGSVSRRNLAPCIAVPWATERREAVSHDSRHNRWEVALGSGSR